MELSESNSVSENMCFPAFGVAGRSRVALSVGGLSFGITGPSEVRLALDPALLDFRAQPGPCDVEIEADWVDQIEMPRATAIFKSGGLWSAYQEAYQQNDGICFYFRTAYLGDTPYKRAWFNRSFTRGRVQLLRRYFDTKKPVYPLEYPLDELLMIHRLSTGEGVEMHGCGILTEDRVGRLFIGHSGAGKSTTSRLWLNQPGVCILSDDRIILRAHEKSLHMYGTPWHGDAGLAAQTSGRLDRIFLLQHGSRNEIIPLEPARAAAELFVRAFVPYHNPAALAHVLRFLEGAASTVPVSIFRFVPDPSAVEAILRAA